MNTNNTQEGTTAPNTTTTTNTNTNESNTNSNTPITDVDEIMANPGEFGTNGLPKSVETTTELKASKDKAWSYGIKFKKALTKKVVPAKASKGTLQKFGVAKEKVFSHACKLCLKKLANNPDAHSNAWATTCLVKWTTTQHVTSHLESMHKDDDEVVALMSEREAEKAVNSAKALQSPEKKPTTMDLIVGKQRVAKLRECQAKWLLLNGIPFHVTQNPEYKAMFQLYDPNFKAISRDTFNKQMNRMFNNMVKSISKLFKKSTDDYQGEMASISIAHDMWTTMNNDAALGSSAKLTTKEMNSYTIAMILDKNNVSHKASHVADRLTEIYRKRYDIDISTDVANVVSDTTKSAANVAAKLGKDQEDCAMHVLSLVLGYSLGVKENTKTERIAGANGTVQKTKTIVTKGGPFTEGMAIVKSSKSVVNYFGGSPQREEALDKCREHFTYPTITLVNPAETRVAYVVKMFRTIIPNVFLLNKMFDSCDEFDKIWDKLSERQQGPNLTPTEALKTMQEMEAVVKPIADYALSAAQSSNGHNSHLLPMYRKLVQGVVGKTTFKVMKLKRAEPDERVSNWPREHRELEHFTAGGKKCLERLRHQLTDRLPPLKPRQCLATLLDPSTKTFASKLLNDSATLYEQTTTLLKEKHRVVYNIIHQKESNDSNESTVPAANGDESLNEPTEVDSDDDDVLMMEADLSQDEEVEADSNLNAEADEQFDKWMNDEPDWNKFLLDEVPPIKKPLVLFDVISKFDTRKYYREFATDKYPAISMLARIHFSRMENAAFQERVFSTAGSAQSKNQGSMSFDTLEKRTLLQANRELIRDGVIDIDK